MAPDIIFRCISIILNHKNPEKLITEKLLLKNAKMVILRSHYYDYWQSGLLLVLLSHFFPRQINGKFVRKWDELRDKMSELAKENTFQ